MNDTGINALEEIVIGGGGSLVQRTEALRREAAQRLNPGHRVQMGQFLTPRPVAAFMAGMFNCTKPFVRILDPGAGTGALSAALVLAMCQRSRRPSTIALTAYEIDPVLIGYLRETLNHCRSACEQKGVSFHGNLVAQDFLEAGANAFAGGLFATGATEHYDCAILNPPYRKIRTESRERRLLRSIGLETTNMYSGFVAVSARLLAPQGELVAITPRSFCNGPYFEPFRRYFLREMRFRRVHVFDTRNSTFADDKVLQENVVFHAVKTVETRRVVVSASLRPGEPGVRRRTIKHEELVRPHDRHAFIHIVPDRDGEYVRRRVGCLGATLSDLGLNVSTGRVVDFRAKEWLRANPGPRTVPLVHPCHLRAGFVEWPNGKRRKPNALAICPGAEALLVPQGYYVLTKRFSAKEERRRVVAAVYDPTRLVATQVGFENHLNYYHAQRSGLPVTIAKGLAAYLNSTLVDAYFRQFSGHTQVNACDLRSMHYPLRSKLVALGRRIGNSFPPQRVLDNLVERVLFGA